VSLNQQERGAGGSAFDVIKRVLVGRQVSSDKLEHTLLPKVLALPVFSSDALSSVAYATEEIMRVLLAASIAGYTKVMPISFAIAALMIIVVISYRQTVRAYPSGGGAYIVSKDNLGVFPGLLAAAALLTDYILTVSVSVVAGVFAITSAVPSLDAHKVLLSIVFIVLITLANLRGVKEAGTLFAVPTYGFILSILILVGLGLARCLGGTCPHAVSDAHAIATGKATGAIGLYIILRAFASGSTALTGVEAISNGVPAFRRPQARNAASTLAILGVVSVVMFLGISFLASHGHAVPSDTKSVVAQVADGVFGHGIIFYVIQVFTAAILILAANTSYQDFPRLSSILARDGYLPRQFENRGDRLVFSNGVIVLAAMASLLVYAFSADLSRLIQLYVVGVFTSFTLSQTGMVRHWLKVRRHGGQAAAGWQRSIVINAIGAAATFVVLIVVIQAKFIHGAWIVIAAMPVIISGFYGIHRHYANVLKQLKTEDAAAAAEPPRNISVLYLESLDEAAAEAVGYIRSYAGPRFRAIHVSDGSNAAELQARWRSFSRTDVELELLPEGDGAVSAVIAYVRAIPREPQDFITVVVPELLTRRSLVAALRRKNSFWLKFRLLREPQVVVTDVPVLREAGAEPDVRPLIPSRLVVLVFISAGHAAAVRAVEYARSLRAPETRAVFFAMDPHDIEDIQKDWATRRVPLPLDIVEAPFRDLGPPVLEEIRRITGGPDAVVSVVVPELVVAKWWQNFLHNQRPLFLKRLLLFEPHVILSSVPYRLK
jgi:amino acid transporter